MGELNADCGLLPLHEGDERLEALHLCIVPDAKVMLVDQSNLLDGRRLDKDKSEATERVAAEMHGVKGAARVAGPGTVVDHRWYDQPVLEGQATKFDWLEQQWRCGSNAIGGRGRHGRPVQ